MIMNEGTAFPVLNRNVRTALRYALYYINPIHDYVSQAHLSMGINYY